MEIGNLIMSKLSITPWAVHSGMLDVFQSVFDHKVNGQSLQAQVIHGQEEYDYDTKTRYTVINERAVLPIHGVVLKKSMGMEGSSGMTTTINIENSLIAASEDRRVKEIIMDFDTPGGTAEGLSEVTALMREIKKDKPIFAVVNDSMYSAGYWMGSAATKIYGYLTSGVGSIGVYMMHIDQSARNEREGVKVTFIKAGKYKTMGNRHEPLSEDAQNEFQRIVDNSYSLFIEEVAANRGRTVEEIASVAEGRLYFGREALEVGLIDELKTFQDVISYSNTYGFLKGEVGMFDKKLKDCTMEDLKAERSDLVASIVAEATEAASANTAAVETELNNLKAENERASKIRKASLELGLFAEGERLIAEGKTVEDAVLALAGMVKQQNSTAQQRFYAAAPKAAGQASEKKEEVELPKNMEEAYKYCKQVHNTGSKAETWKKARAEFPELFRANNAKGE
jgi:signal peptide peptidase SppA